MDVPGTEPETRRLSRRVACAGPSPDILRCTGLSVRATDGLPLGRISGFVVDDDDGVLFAVICFGSAARLGEDARVVPWRLVDTDGDVCTVRLTAACVRAAPIFVSGTCCSDAAWWCRVEDHFRRVAT